MYACKIDGDDKETFHIYANVSSVEVILSLSAVTTRIRYIFMRLIKI